MRVVSFLLNSLPFVIQFYVNQYLEDDYVKTSIELESELNVPKIKVFDFIVVGGGTAGCVVAGRLSKRFNVLLLEAGGTPPPATDVSYYTAEVGKNPDINYFFKSIDKSKSSRINGGDLIHTGKMLGGSGTHNDMVHSRGSPADYDNWATITNDDSFKYANVLKYFKKSENFIGDKFETGTDEYYGKGGPITVDTNFVPILPLWFAAGKELGYEPRDPNGFQREGFAPLNKAMQNGRRSSSYGEYIKPFENSANLTVIRYANVSEILLDENKKAYGVAYTRHDVFPQIAYATKEIILSAGAFSSPLLLMKSGIGPVETLRAAEIPVKVPLEAVGKQLSEHVAVTLSQFHVNDSSLFLSFDPNGTEKLVEDYHKGKGTLAMITEGPQCFLASSKAQTNWPDLWIAMNPFVTIDGEQQQVGLYAILGRPKSRGELNLNTEKYKNGVRDDVQLALIDYNFFSNPDDMDAMLEVIKFALRIAEDTKAFQSINMTYNEGPVQACLQYTYRSDAYWRCHVEQKLTPWIHMVGTCSMGPDTANSNSSVVDTKFRVRGVTGLRVVDASVIPVITNANLNAPILMLGEKASEDILNAW